MITRNKIRTNFLENLKNHGKLITLKDDVCNVIANEVQKKINEKFKKSISKIQYVSCFSPEINTFSLLMLFSNENKRESFAIRHGCIENGQNVLSDEYGLCVLSTIKSEEDIMNMFETALERYRKTKIN